MRFSLPILTLALAALVSARFQPLYPVPEFPPPESEQKNLAERDTNSFIDIINEIYDMYADPAGLEVELDLRTSHRLQCFSNVPEQTDQMVTGGCFYAGTRCRGKELIIKNCPSNLATCWCTRYVFFFFFFGEVRWHCGLLLTRDRIMGPGWGRLI